MADPVTLSALSIGATVAGGAVSAGGGIMGGNAEAAAKSYQAQVARINKQVALMNRDQTLTAGADKALATGIAGRQKMGQIITAQAASGLDITKGSLARVQEGQQTAISNDIAHIYDNTARQAYGYTVKAANEESSAGMYEAGAKSAKNAAMIKALGTVIGTAGSVSSKWLQGNQLGLWGGDDAVDVGSATEWWKDEAA